MNRRPRLGLLVAILASAGAAIGLGLVAGRWVAADSPRAACQRQAPPWATAECPAAEPTATPTPRGDAE